MDKMLKIKTIIFQKLVFKEMSSINTFMGENDIRGIFVKGLTLAHELYERPEERSFGDIDLFVHHKDLYKFNKYLSDNGYRDENGKKIEPDGGLFSYYKPIHLDAFYKGDTIMLEIHIMPYFTNTHRNSVLSEELYEDFFNLKNIINIDGEDFPSLRPDANALFLLDHFIKHLTFYIKEYTITGYNEIHVEMDKLEETKRYIEKYNISFNDLLVLAEKYNSVPVLLLAYKYMNEAFGGFDIDIDIDIINSINLDEYVNKLPCVENKIIRKLYDVSLNDVLQNSENFDYFINILKSLPYTPAHVLKVPKRKAGESGVVFEIDPENPTGIFKSHYQQKSTDEKCYAFKMRSTVNWDEQGLNIHSIMYDEAFPDRDGNLIIFKFFKTDDPGEFPEHIYMRILIPKEDKSKINYELVQGTAGDIRHLKFISFTYVGNCYSLYASIPWALLGIEPKKGSKLLFDYCVLSKNRETIWDSFHYGCLDKMWDRFSYSLIELT